MRSMKIAFVVALAVGSLSGSANATIVARGVNTAVDGLSLVDQVEFIFGAHRHCWYAEGWHGPGWYWCGYAGRKGRGWGGGEGYRGWKH